MLSGLWLPSDEDNRRLSPRTSGLEHFTQCRIESEERNVYIFITILLRRGKLETMPTTCLIERRQGIDHRL